MAFKERTYSRGRNLTNYAEPIKSAERTKRYLRNSQMTSAGVEVRNDEVMQVDTILACVRVLTEALASLPLELLHKDEQENVTRATEHPAYELIRWQPNEETTAYEARLWQVQDAIVWGAGYQQVRWDGRGKIIDIWNLVSKNVKPRRAPKNKGGRLFYTYCPDGDKGSSKDEEIMLEANEVFKLQVLPGGGLLNQSIMDLQKEAIGASKASEMYASEFFKNGGVVSGVIEVPDEMSEVSYNRLKKDWNESHAQKGKRHGVPILEANAKFNPLALNHEETQLLETRKFQRSTLAGLLRVPAHMINDLEKATFSNIEHQDLNFVKHTLRPWMTNIEQRCRLTLLSKTDRVGLYFKHNDRDLLRGDFPSRATAYSLLVNCGVMSPNDARTAEDMNRYPGGDTYMVNGTLIDITKISQQAVRVSETDPNAPKPVPVPKPKP